MKATRVILVAVAASLLAMPVMAADTAQEPAKGPGVAKKWDAMDANKDGFVSKAEWSAEGDKMFDKRDTDHDGKISKEEWQHKHAEMRAKRTEHRKEWKAAHPAAAAPAAGETAPASAPAPAAAQ